MLNKVLSSLIATIVFTLLLFLNDFTNPNLEIHSFLSYFFNFETLLFMFPFFIYFAIILIPTSYLIEVKLIELHWFKQLLLYGFIGVIASVVITSILELQFAFDSHLTFSISLAFLVFGFIQKTTQN